MEKENPPLKMHEKYVVYDPASTPVRHFVDHLARYENTEEFRTTYEDAKKASDHKSHPEYHGQRFTLIYNGNSKCQIREYGK